MARSRTPLRVAIIGTARRSDYLYGPIVQALPEDVELVGDSASVIHQAMGTRKCRDPAMRRHLAAYREATATISRVRLRYTPRSKNLAGIVLAKGHAR